jgi:hypothetical protein
MEMRTQEFDSRMWDFLLEAASLVPRFAYACGASLASSRHPRLGHFYLFIDSSSPRRQRAYLSARR